MKAEHQRIIDLEKALERAVSYLHRLPLVPATYYEIEAAEAVLCAPNVVSDAPPVYGGISTAAGVPLLALKIKPQPVEIIKPPLNELRSYSLVRREKELSMHLTQGASIPLDSSEYYQRFFEM